MKLIETTDELSAACARLAQHPFITIDTEFIRETTFWPELCLVQIASTEEAVLVDPLADGISLDPMFSLLADKNVLKVFHAARQDIEIFFNLAAAIPEPIFDTQVAAMVCGFGDAIAYDQLVKRITGAHIDKSSRFTDWRQRPLSDKQLSYALADVTHLRDVYAELSQQLQAAHREHWVREEMSVLTARETYDLHPEDAWQKLKLRVRKPIELQILKNLAAWREREARARNQPRRRILKDDAIYEIAQQQPRTPEALARLRSLNKGIERSSMAQPMIKAVTDALALDKSELPAIPRAPASPEGTSAAVDLLRVVLKLTAEEQGVAQKIIATTDDLEKIAIKGDEADVGALKGWRREVFGEKALKTVNGEIAIRFDDRKLSVVDLG
ncbi:ribonuclease D [Oricola cellulosilytica]|uniref:Ribonuclease D n=1 Tax=Oricola cellulosilytica TaxID=1429082 RepID=A0A4R0PDQ7_9HYPH|nr:ribonuclease D [Oricola cellulosilytica]TCD14335.1 ribonuclease D [Oricola cellulosilytica]